MNQAAELASGFFDIDFHMLTQRNWFIVCYEVNTNIYNVSTEIQGEDRDWSSMAIILAIRRSWRWSLAKIVFVNLSIISQTGT